MDENRGKSWKIVKKTREHHIRSLLGFLDSLDLFLVSPNHPLLGSSEIPPVEECYRQLGFGATL